MLLSCKERQVMIWKIACDSFPFLLHVPYFAKYSGHFPIFLFFTDDVSWIIRDSLHFFNLIHVYVYVCMIDIDRCSLTRSELTKQLVSHLQCFHLPVYIWNKQVYVHSSVSLCMANVYASWLWFKQVFYCLMDIYILLIIETLERSMIENICMELLEWLKIELIFCDSLLNIRFIEYNSWLYSCCFWVSCLKQYFPFCLFSTIFYTVLNKLYCFIIALYFIWYWFFHCFSLHWFFHWFRYRSFFYWHSSIR